MDVGTVLVLGDVEHASAVGAFVNGELTTVLVGASPSGVGAPWARLCGEIAQLDPPGPLFIVAFGAAAAYLPHVALAQRAARRRIGEYVLVHPTLPAVTESWPDAPVTVYCDLDDDGALQGRLRGWSVKPVEQLPMWRPAE